MPELIEEGRSGLLVEDLVESYHRIDEIFKMDRQYIANRARLLFNYQNMTKQYIDAYHKVLTAFASRQQQQSLVRRILRHTPKW
jgi:hypothetical protein